MLVDKFSCWVPIKRVGSLIKETGGGELQGGHQINFADSYVNKFSSLVFSFHEVVNMPEKLRRGSKRSGHTGRMNVGGCSCNNILFRRGDCIRRGLRRQYNHLNVF